MIVDPSLLSPLFEVRQTRVDALTNYKSVVGANARRIVLMFCHAGGSGNIFLQVDRAGTVAQGWVLAANGGVLELVWSKHGALVGREWFGQGSGAGANLVMLECIYNPPAPREEVIEIAS